MLSMLINAKRSSLRKSSPKMSIAGFAGCCPLNKERRMFFKGSRYENVATNEIMSPDGRIYRYKKTRFIGPATPQQAHSVTAGDRLDLIAHLHFRDSERFWRVCDA